MMTEPLILNVAKAASNRQNFMVGDLRILRYCCEYSEI